MRIVTRRIGGDHRNLDLHGWAFDCFMSMLEYKAEVHGIELVQKSERETSKSCPACGRCDDGQRVKRGLYVCDECGLVANADTNGAENIRQKVLPNPQREDRDNGWMAQPAVRLFDHREGYFVPQEQVTQTNREL